MKAPELGGMPADKAMKRDAAATKARLAAAARAEFAARGIAGARVDRIAAAAGANKNLIYVYFGSKEQLFAAVLAEALTELVNAVPLNARDLPSYAVALFDHDCDHADLSRLARWHGLERRSAASPMPKPDVATDDPKVEAVAAAQRAGVVNAAIPAPLLLDLVYALAITWSAGSPLPVEASDAPENRATRRAAVQEAVRRLTSPRAADPVERT
jgi:AcrR family transcriptional regulator